MNDVKRTGVFELRLVALLTVVAALAAACSSATTEESTTSPSNETTTSTAVTRTTEPPAPNPFRVGLTANISTDNWWASLDTLNQPQNRTYLASSKTALFDLTLPGFALVPAMAATAAPVQPTQQESSWVIEQPIVRDRTWSDGEPITAQDLVFYFDTVREFDLGDDHEESFPESVTSITAPDDYTVRIEFSERPGLALWNSLVPRAPWVPSHWWQQHVDSAREAAETAAAEITTDEARAAIVEEASGDEANGDTLTEADVTQEQIAEYIAAAGAAEGRAVLYAIPGIGEPSAGPIVVDRWEQGELAVSVPNPDYFASGTEKTIYSDGSVRIADAARGTDEVYGGAGSGEILAHYVEGPFVPEVMWVEHATREDAYEALARGELDYVLDSNGMPIRLRDELSSSTDLQFTVSQTEGFRYLAFNLRKPPMSDAAFRRAAATLINKETIAEEVLDGAVAPAYAVVHPDLIGAYNDEIERPGWKAGEPMDDGARFEAAVQILDEAGYTWEVEPVVESNDEGSIVDVTPGDGLTMPNGRRVPELSILAPGADYDPFRNTFSVEAASSMRDLGIPVTVEENDFDAIVDAVFPPQTPESALAWDMYVLGWGAADPVIPGTSLRAFFHSDQDAVFGGGVNTGGYNSTEFDAVANAFDAATSIGEAAELTKQMDAIVARDLPYVVLFRPRIIEALGSEVGFPTSSIMGGHQGLARAWPGVVQVGD